MVWEPCLKNFTEMCGSQIFYIFYLILQRPGIRWFGNPVLRILQRCVAHRFFIYFGNIVAVVNIIIITVSHITIITQYKTDLVSIRIRDCLTMKRKFKQWWSTITLISTKQIINSRIKSLNINPLNRMPTFPHLIIEPTTAIQI